MRTGLMSVVAALMVAGCGGDSGIPILMVNDLCQYDGPDQVDEGEVRLTLQRTGLGDYGAAVVALEGGHDPEELVTHFEEVDSDWGARPDWVTVRHQLETRDEDLTSDDHTGETELISLPPGEHSVVCINFSDGRAGVAATIDVVAQP